MLLSIQFEEIIYIYIYIYIYIFEIIYVLN